MKIKSCYAYCIEAEKTWCLNISLYGVSKDWPDDIIWDVARREMKNHYGKPVTCWRWLDERK